jgi:hypothetical protein
MPGWRQVNGLVPRYSLDILKLLILIHYTK